MSYVKGDRIEPLMQEERFGRGLERLLGWKDRACRIPSCLQGMGLHLPSYRQPEGCGVGWPWVPQQTVPQQNLNLRVTSGLSEWSSELQFWSSNDINKPAAVALIYRTVRWSEHWASISTHCGPGLHLSFQETGCQEIDPESSDSFCDSNIMIFFLQKKITQSLFCQVDKHNKPF